MTTLQPRLTKDQEEIKAWIHADFLRTLDELGYSSYQEFLDGSLMRWSMRKWWLMPASLTQIGKIGGHICPYNPPKPLPPQSISTIRPRDLSRPFGAPEAVDN